MDRLSDVQGSSAIGAAASKLSPRFKKPSFSPKKKGSSKTKKSSAEKSSAAKNTAAAKPKAERPKKTDVITSGPNATHARNADTGKPVKLNAQSRAAVSSFYSRQIGSSTQHLPAVNLEGPSFAEKPSKVPVKNSRTKKQ